MSQPCRPSRDAGSRPEGADGPGLRRDGPGSAVVVRTGALIGEESAPPPPPVMVTDEEYVALADLVCGAPRATAGLALLWRELQRAAVIPAGRAPTDLVRMGSRVAFTDLGRREARSVRVVHPSEVLQPIRVPVTMQVGAALLGLRPGAEFEWLQDDGERRLIRVDAVDAPLRPRVLRRRHAD